MLESEGATPKKGIDLKTACSTAPCIGPERVSEQTGVPAGCFTPDCPHKLKLKETLVEAIEALEKTKATFKSKQIETLRKKLMKVLLENM